MMDLCGLVFVLCLTPNKQELVDMVWCVNFFSPSIFHHSLTSSQVSNLLAWFLLLPSNMLANGVHFHFVIPY